MAWSIAACLIIVIEYSVSAERIRQLEKSAMGKLKKAMTAS